MSITKVIMQMVCYATKFIFLMRFLFWKILIIFHMLHKMLSIIMPRKLVYILWSSPMKFTWVQSMGNRVIEASVAHKRIEGSRSNLISSTVGKGGGLLCQIAEISDFSSIAHCLCDPGPIKSLVALVSSPVKACLVRLLRGLNKWIRNECRTMHDHKKGSTNVVMIKIKYCAPKATLCTSCNISMH